MPPHLDGSPTTTSPQARLLTITDSLLTPPGDGHIFSQLGSKEVSGLPIYEYQCTKCQDEFDVIQGFSDKPLKKCKKCGGKLRKLISECSFHLKGTGWYVTDYGKKDKTTEKSSYDAKKKEKSDTGSNTKSPAESESKKTDSEPKAKSKSD
jgi:putative FmdB family regulatory protein